MSPSSLHRRQWLQGLALGSLASVAGVGVVRQCLASAAAGTALVTAPQNSQFNSASAAKAYGLEQIQIAVGGQGLLYYLPLVVAQQLQFFAAEGVQVQVQDYVGSQEALEAVRTGVAQIGSGAFVDVLMEQARGHYVKAFVLQGRMPQMALGVSTRWMKGYQALPDLAGRRFGVSLLDASTIQATQLVLLRAGLPLDAVQYMEVGSGSEAIAALQSGRVHALCQPDPLISVLEDRGDVQIICDLRNPKECEQLYGGVLPSGTLYASDVFLQRNEAQAQAVTNAMLRALRWLQTASMLDLLKVVPPNYLLGSRRAYLAAFEKMRSTISPDGLMSADGPLVAQRSLQRLYEAQAQAPSTLGKNLDVERSYTNALVKRGKQQLHL